jgi:flagellar FliJ protein
MGPIKQLVDEREREAGDDVARARQALEAQERQLSQLRAYRADYAEKVSSVAAPDGVRLQNYHAFLGRLADAIAQQERAVTDALAVLERATDVWRERRIEAASIGKAVNNLARGERKVADQRDQRESDERAMQRILRAREPG